MSSANVVVRIANLSVSLVGHIRGGLSQVVVVFSMFFSEMSGSTTADVAVMSRALGGPMKREGYEPAFIAAIIASASTIAALVPPSITAVVYGAVGNVSIAGLFMAGVVPGLMIGFGLMIYCYFFGPSGLRKPRAPLRQVVFAAGDAALPLMIPVILLGGILTGWFTPTEAGVVAVVWIVVVVIPALNRGHIRKIPYDFCLAGLIFSLPLITIGAANAFGWMLAYLRGASYIAEVITSIAGNDPHLIMLLMVLLFTVVGDFIEPVPTIIIFMPLVNTLTEAGDINAVHMGVVLIATLAFGLITPPYGLVLLMASKFVGVELCEGVARRVADLSGLPRRRSRSRSTSRAWCCGCRGRCCRNRSAASSRRRGRATSVPSSDFLDPPLSGFVQVAKRRAVAVLEVAARERVRHALHHRVMADEQQIVAGMTVEPCGNASQRPFGHGVPVLAVGGQDRDEAGRGSDAVLDHEVADGQALEAAEIELDDAVVDRERHRDRVGDDLGRSRRAHQRACDDAADAGAAQHASCLVRLPQTILVQRVVRPALKEPVAIPVGRAVTKAAEGARGCHLLLLVNFFTAARNSSVFIAMMILCSSASSCCFTGVVAAW